MNELTIQTAATSAANVSLMMFDPAKLQAVEAFAVMMSKGSVTVPKHLQGKPSDCLALTLQAMRWGMDPYVVAQKTHIVNGNLGYEAQLIIAVLQNSGAVRGRPHFEFRGEGDSLECRAAFVPAGEADLVWTEWLASKAITVKNSPLWKTNPKQQMGYVQSRNWARLYAPGALLGVYTTDELETVNPDTGEITGRRGVPATSGTVERVEPVIEQGRPTLPAYTDAQMEANLPAWADIVSSGRKTPGELLAMLSTKATFSEPQKARILSLKAAPDEPASTDAAGDDFAAAYDAAEGGAR